jgi:2-oxo-4-hydroxy-4-carboxy-5-ureidoimidazoline decarboxylase
MPEAGPAPRAALHDVLNALSVADARAALLRCCGSLAWADAILARRPFASTAALFAAADAVWVGLDRADHLQAFSHHPAIGAHGAHGFSAEEQAQVLQSARSGGDTQQALATLNGAYQERFGFVFLICATGKSAEEILAQLRVRIDNPPETELRIAAGEQAKITRLRLEKLVP